MRIPISVPGLALLKAELEELRKARPEVVQAVKDAQEEGDPNENTGYQAASERLNILDTKLRYLEARMSLLHVVDFTTMPSDSIAYGATVTLEDLDTGEIKKYTILGPDETDYVKNSVSALSPVGSALLGKIQGDDVSVDAPRGRLEYEIIAVEYKDPAEYFPKPAGIHQADSAGTKFAP